MKLINKPSGAALEYSSYAMSFYEGCTPVKCSYCYMQTMSKRFGSYFGVARLKEWLINEDNAFEVFKKEVNKIIPKLQKEGLFFNFSSDPFLLQAIELNLRAWNYCNELNIPVYTLSKQAFPTDIDRMPKNVIVGYTLTGRDDLEPDAATNAKRILELQRFNWFGFKTWASIEPIINLRNSISMIRQVLFSCDLFKIGIESGKKYDLQLIRDFIEDSTDYIGHTAKIYFKDSLLKQAGLIREDLPANCVGRDFKLHNGQ